MENLTTNITISISSSSYFLITIQRILIWSMLSFLIFGNIGNLFNCFVFLQKSLRTNACSCYLLVSSVANIFALSFGITSGIYGYARVNPTSYSLIYCKLRLYIYHSLLMISRYLIILACIDRACLSSRQVYIRNFSQFKFARLLSLIVIIFWTIATIHMPIFTIIQSNQCTMLYAYNLAFSIYAVVFAGTVPPILMSIFSLITIHNLHSIHMRNSIVRRIQQRDIHLIRMLIAQVIVYVLTTTPYPLSKIYSFLTLSISKSIDRQIIEEFIYFLTSSFLLFLNPTISFYIYMITSKAFRVEFQSVCTYFWQKIFVKQQNLANITLRFLTPTIVQRQQDGLHSSSPSKNQSVISTRL